MLGNKVLVLSVLCQVYILQEVAGNNWRRADMLKHWVRYGGIMIMGYSLYRNLSQSFRIRSKHQKKIFQEALVDPGEMNCTALKCQVLYCWNAK